MIRIEKLSMCCHLQDQDNIPTMERETVSGGFNVDYNFMFSNYIFKTWQCSRMAALGAWPQKTEREQFPCTHFYWASFIHSQRVLKLFERGPHAAKRHHKPLGQLKVQSPTTWFTMEPSSLSAVQGQMLFIATNSQPNELHYVDTARGLLCCLKCELLAFRKSGMPSVEKNREFFFSHCNCARKAWWCWFGCVYTATRVGGLAHVFRWLRQSLLLSC